MSLANQYNYVVKVIENDRLQAENKSLREYLERDTALVAQQAAMIEQMRKAFMKLACLGNGDRHGNSVGNQIAIAALALQPCPEVLNKVRADAVREAAKQFGAGIEDDLLFIAQRIEQGEA